ncbi:MAG: methyltransferase domain-containing protein [Candidatus Bathyarchaeota archaeon]|nr:MAG: methyltransferase domain-containing protein [Candidatus Bathyarchaeota archaeon]
MTEKEEIVRKGYDKIAKQYHADRHIFDNRKELEQFVSLLPRNARVLDVGCGSGYTGEYLVEHGFNVVGVDFSQSMLKLAGRNVPEANLIKQDATRLGFKTNSFDGLTSFYCIIHIPREKHASLFQSFHRILKPEGIMLISMGYSEWEGTEKYFGVDMFWSHYGPEKSLQIIENAGLLAIWDKIVECGGEKPYWVLARNKK